MNKIVISLFVLAAGVPLLLADPTSQRTKERDETRSSGGKTTFHYAYSFDAEDYAVLSILLETKPDGEAQVLARAPHGPTPSCDSRYTTNSLAYLKQKMPTLKDETYSSFLERNNRIAVHRIKQFKDGRGRFVQVVEKEKNRHSASQYSRAGFSKDKKQVLVFNGQLFLLYHREGDTLKEVGRCVMWIS